MPGSPERARLEGRAASGIIPAALSSGHFRIEPGTAVGAFVVERALASSGLGSLFVAKDDHGREVVVRAVAEESAPARVRTLREGRALMAIEHPALARVVGVGEAEGFVWTATERARGTDLRHLVDEGGGVALERALGWIGRAAEGLA